MSKRIITWLLITAICIPFVQGSVSNAEPSAKLCKKHITLNKGCKYTIKIKGSKNKKAAIWKSSDKNIVSVNKKGVITAIKKGSATVTARLKGQKLRCKIVVKGKKTSQPAGTVCPAVPKSSADAQCPEASLCPATSQEPTISQEATVTQKPAVTNCPVLGRFPSSIIPGLYVWTPNCPQSPAATDSTSVTQPPVIPPSPAAPQIPTVPQSTAIPQIPTATSQPTDNSSSYITEEQAYQILNSLRSTYPEGMPLTNSYYYYSPCFGNGYGCYGFAAKLSDTVFGTGKSCSTHTSFEKIKVGDNIRIGNRHSVIVLTKSGNSITVVEGNYNSSVHWDRTITKNSLANEGFKVTTRY